MDTPNPLGPPENPPAPPPIVCGDPETEALLRRHAAGEKLTAQEYGKVGNYRSKLARAAGKPPGRPATPRNAADPAPPSAGAADAASEGPAPAGSVPLAGAVGAPPIGSDVICKTTSGILKACDRLGQNFIRAEANAAGIGDAAASRLATAAALTPEARDVMVDTSPAVFAALGVDPSNYPATVFLAALGTWAASLAGAVAEIKSLAASRPQPPPA